MFSVFSEIMNFSLVNAVFVTKCKSSPIPRPAQDPLHHRGPHPPRCCHLSTELGNIASMPREDKYIGLYLTFCIINAVLNIHCIRVAIFALISLMR